MNLRLPHLNLVLTALILGAIAAPSVSVARDALRNALCNSFPEGVGCVAVVACIGEAGRWLKGVAIGQTDGAIYATTNDGVECSGTWTSKNWYGAGQTNMNCADGLTARVVYTYQDRESGTAYGKGRTNTGERVVGWAGTRLLADMRVLNGTDPDEPAMLVCGSKAIPLE